MNTFPILHTERLHLRELVADDAPVLFEIYRNAEAMRWFGIDPMTELAQAHALIATFSHWRTQPNPGTRWGLEHDGRLLGSCGLFKWNRSWNSCSLACELAPSAWGNGLMSEALHAMLEWGFAQMQLHRVEALVHPRNSACQALLGRLGFTQEGMLREAGFWGGRYQDLQIFSLLCHEYSVVGFGLKARRTSGRHTESR
ncbi:GNAT family N-acetyltransferase [Pseudomonas mucidolens]|uniref:Ribosomal-protein-alanine N-acetyltransferase n=1 Tax=Pseudomonas mucidolens TaxID=46679 RepID=A0A1H2MYI3_9PSED|nr:GNAT family protein [Pseudomonas mucidolens]SDU98413.1 ribosomal-protein-alanine N-acetyltransferase [Pseudomonas mucidolens]SQH32950.1 N-acetyltransferase YoaA [Pseudomonas mucidolens]